MCVQKWRKFLGSVNTEWKTSILDELWKTNVTIAKLETLLKLRSCLQLKGILIRQLLLLLRSKIFPVLKNWKLSLSVRKFLPFSETEQNNIILKAKANKQQQKKEDCAHILLVPLKGSSNLNWKKKNKKRLEKQFGSTIKSPRWKTTRLIIGSNSR